VDPFQASSGTGRVSAYLMMPAPRCTKSLAHKASKWVTGGSSGTVHLPPEPPQLAGQIQPNPGNAAAQSGAEKRNGNVERERAASVAHHRTLARPRPITSLSSPSLPTGLGLSDALMNHSGWLAQRVRPPGGAPAVIGDLTPTPTAQWRTVHPNPNRPFHEYGASRGVQASRAIPGAGRRHRSHHKPFAHQDQGSSGAAKRRGQGDPDFRRFNPNLTPS